MIDRCNLTILLAPRYADLPAFLARHEVEVVCSLPHYRALSTDRQRGEGVYVWNSRGRRLFDAYAGLAVVNVGHGRAEIADAVRAARARGFLWRQVWGALWRQPEWWMGLWYPRPYRRGGDVWDRLPGPVRAWRVIVTALAADFLAFLYLWLLLGPVVGRFDERVLLAKIGGPRALDALRGFAALVEELFTWVGGQARRHLGRLGRVARLLAEELLRATERGLHVLHLAVLQRDREPARGAPGGDVAAHHAGADHVHVPDLAPRPAAQRLEAVLQEEHPHQVPRLLGEEQFRNRARLGLVGGRPGRAVAGEQVDDGPGSWVVSGIGAARDLLARLRGEGLLDRLFVPAAEAGLAQDGQARRSRRTGIAHGGRIDSFAPDDVPALVAALRTLLSDAGLRERMGKNARRRAVEELSVDRFAENVFDLYREMMKA